MTGIIAFDRTRKDWEYPVEILNDGRAAKWVVGAAFHGYEGNVNQQSNFHDAFPDSEVYYTEITGGDFAINYSNNQVYTVLTSIIGVTRNHAQSSLY